MLYRDSTLSVGIQRAMPEAQSTWTKRVGAEPKKTMEPTLNLIIDFSTCLIKKKILKK